MKLQRLPVLGAVVVVVAVLAGCGGGNGGSAGGKERTTTGARPLGGGTPMKKITINETEFKLTPSNVSLPKPGTYEFTAVNKGSVTHALEIEGKGVEDETDDISPGESKTLEVTFKGGGSYEMYCPVDGHKDRGMEGKITVGSSGAGSGGTTTAETETTDTDTTETETGSGY